jgi:hypothetical protein
VRRRGARESAEFWHEAAATRGGDDDESADAAADAADADAGCSL